jgi:hypothetical protein
MHDDFGLRYINCGDWVESCTAVIEHRDGRFEIVDWSRVGHDAEPAPADEAADGVQTAA